MILAMKDSTIKLIVNGKTNPVAVARDRVRLSVITEGVQGVDEFIYAFYRSKLDVERGDAFIYKKTTARYAYFDGAVFCDCKKYFATVTAKTDGGLISSGVVEFTTALSSDSFTAKWIENPNFDGRVSEFRKNFNVSGKIESAYLYAVGLGFYDAFVNGKKTDEYYFKPVLTDFDKRLGLNNPHYDESNFDNGKYTVCYDVFDVTDLLVDGENFLTFTLGTGWYCNTDKDITDPSYSFGTPKLIFELHLKTQDGYIKVLSGEDCLVRSTAVVSQMFKGDRIDFSAKDLPFSLAAVCDPPAGKLTLNATENDVLQEKILPLAVKKQNGVIEYDFGKNHTGSLYLKVRGKKDDKLTVRYYENKKDGVLDPLSSRWDAYKDGIELIDYLDQTSEYVLSGEIDEIKPVYHWNCYRYATVECADRVEILTVESHFIAADVKENMAFDCSEPIVKKMHDAFVLTQKDNMHCGVPSDCPSREKLPYTGDGQIVCESTSYCFDAENFYRKWLDDIIDSQGKNGFVAYTAPIIAGGGGYWWSNALVVVPLILYKTTGDKEILRHAHAPCKRLIDYYETTHGGDYIVNKSFLRWFLGEWCTPDSIQINRFFVNTLAAFFAASGVEEICRILGDTDGEQKCVLLKDNFKAAINRNYFDRETASYLGGIQGANAMPLLYDIVEDEYREKLKQNIRSQYDATGLFDTGIIMTPALLDCLASMGEYELCYKLLTGTGEPSFWNMLKGETTLVECWTKRENCGRVSHCHPMFGSVLAWVYKNIAGVDLTGLCCGEIEFSPKLIKKIACAKMVKETTYGVVKSEYKTDGGNFEYRLVVPFGVNAKVKLPKCLTGLTLNGESLRQERKEGGFYVFSLAAGTYEIKAKV